MLTSSDLEIQKAFERKVQRKRRRKVLTIKWALSLFFLIIALIPTWIFAAIYLIAGPSSFWERFAVFGAGAFFMGSFQIALLIVWIATTIHIATMD